MYEWLIGYASVGVVWSASCGLAIDLDAETTPLTTPEGSGSETSISDQRKEPSTEAPEDAGSQPDLPSSEGSSGVGSSRVLFFLRDSSV